MTFDFNRLNKLLAYDLRTNFRTYASTLGIGLGVILAFLLADYVLFVSKESLMRDPLDPVGTLEYTLFWIGLIIVVLLGGGMMFSPLKNKTGRISFLMLPASNLEKFAARWLILCPGFLAAYLIGFSIIDLVQYAFGQIFYGGYGYFTLHFASIARMAFYEPSCYLIASLFATQPVFILGSSLWPKHAMRNTIAFILIFNFVTSIWVFVLSIILIKPGYEYGWFLADINTAIVPYAIFGFYAVSYICITALAYCRFKEIEIIQRW